MAETIIEARGLKKSYGDFEAVKGVDFSILKGKCFGLLGPNGAGKSTTMRMIIGLTSKTDGELKVFGESQMSREAKSKVGLVPQEDNLDIDLSVRENLETYGRYFDLPTEEIKQRVSELLKFMQLEDKIDNRVQSLSGGMKRRLVIARSMIANPELVILDEPTTGLDPQARVLIWKCLLDLKKQGKTLLLTTHYMDEAQRLCDHIVVIDGGKVLDEGSPSELISRHVKGHVYEVVKPLRNKLADTTLDREDIGDSVLFYVKDPADIRDELPNDGMYTHRMANLEDVFLRLTGRQLREG